MWLLIAILACGGDSGDSGPPADDVADAGSGDTGGGDAGADGGADSGATGCDSRAWRKDAEVRLAHQADVDGFCDSYNAVDGDLVVDVGSTDDPITQLDGIGCLCEVTGSLTITGDGDKAPPLDKTGAPPHGAQPGERGGQTVDSASRAVPLPPPHVTGDIELTALERVGGDLAITWHPSLTYVEAMRALREVGGDIILAGNPELQVTSFYGLERLGGRLILRQQDKQLILRIPQATTIGGLDLGEAGDAATMSYLVEVKLDALQEVTGDVRLIGPRNLALLSAPQLTRIEGGLHIEAACRTALSLPVLQSAGSVVLDGMCALQDLTGMPALRQLTGQDADGTSLRLHADEGLDADEIAAFVSQLEDTGPGAVDVDNTGTCADVMAAYGEGYCD